MTEGNPNQDNSFDEYDHDYIQITECKVCRETHDNCECDTYQPIEMEGVDECEDCGLPKADPTHGETDE